MKKSIWIILFIVVVIGFGPVRSVACTDGTCPPENQVAFPTNTTNPGFGTLNSNGWIDTNAIQNESFDALTKGFKGQMWQCASITGGAGPGFAGSAISNSVQGLAQQMSLTGTNYNASGSFAGLQNLTVGAGILPDSNLLDLKAGQNMNGMAIFDYTPNSMVGKMDLNAGASVYGSGYQPYVSSMGEGVENYNQLYKIDDNNYMGQSGSSKITTSLTLGTQPVPAN